MEITSPLNSQPLNSEEGDTRTPSPPDGYSKPCTHSPMEQVRVVAEFHAHKINPARIAYRTGIDIALINKLLAGEIHAELFTSLTEGFRNKRRQQRLKNTQTVKPRFRGRRMKLDVQPED